MALLGTVFAAMGWREIQSAMKTDFSKISSKFVEVLDKKGLWEAMKETLSDEQVKALGDNLKQGLVKTFDDIFNPLVKGLGIIIGDHNLPSELDNAAQRAANALNGNNNEDMKKVAQFQVDHPETKFSPLKNKDDQNNLELLKHDIKRDQSKTAKDKVSDFFLGNAKDDAEDAAALEQYKRVKSPIGNTTGTEAPTEASKSFEKLYKNLSPVASTRSVANNIVQQQDIATKTDVATTTAIQNGSGSAANSGGSSSTSVSNVSNNAVTINNYASTLRNEVLSSVTELKNMH